MQSDLILALQGTSANTSLQLEAKVRFAGYFYAFALKALECSKYFMSAITEPHLSGDLK